MPYYYGKVNEYFEELNKNKYSVLVPSNKSKKIKKLWITVD